ncbi:D-hydantoinase/dihydropyrimidinase [bacterium HR33]|nr:D-hydantoinase/dihydropyrimidinase [bacterium HR33]
MRSLVFVAVLMAPAVAEAQGSFVIKNVRVYDGERVLPAATVVVVGGHIQSVGKDSAVPAGVEVVDGSGRTLLPGLIDSHTHTLAAEHLRTALAFGVTTVLDMFSVPNLVKIWKGEQAAGQAWGRADIFSAGILATAPGGHGTEYGMVIPTVSSASEAEGFVAARLAEGSDWIKIVYDDGASYGLSYATLNEATLRALVQAAHRRGKLAVVHISTLSQARTAVRAGVDGLVHIWHDSVPDRDFVRELRSRNVFVIPTLTVLESATGVASGAVLLEDGRVAPFLDFQARSNLKRAFPRRAGAQLSLEPALVSVRRLAEAGVTILAGTDASNPGTWYGASVHRELELLVEAGLTPERALQAATSLPAAAFGLDGRGRIAPGLAANLVLVEGDPTTHVADTRAIVAVWKEGRKFDRDSLRKEISLALEGRANAPPALPFGTGGILVSDFDDGTTKAAFGSWSSTTDAMAGGKSTAVLDVAEGGAEGTPGALKVHGEIAPGLMYAWAGAMFFPGDRPMSPANLASASGFSFYARGDGKTYRVLLFTQKGGAFPAVSTFTAGAEWQEVSFTWQQLQGGDGSDVVGIAIVAGPDPGPYEFWIDQMRIR